MRVLRHSFALALATLLIFAHLLCSGSTESQRTERARLKISGHGLLGNLELRRLLQSLDSEWRKRETFDANFIEDTALILLSTLQRDGYLYPSISVQIVDTEGTSSTYHWDTVIDPPLPRPLAAKRVEFRLSPGKQYRYGTISVVGSKVLEPKQVRSFFVERVLLPLKQTRIYTPDRAERSVANLREALMRRGFEKPQVTLTNLVRDDQTGRVNLTVLVDEGLRSLVRSIKIETFSKTNQPPENVEVVQTNAYFSQVWQQDFSQILRSTNYHEGFPDTTVTVSRLAEEQNDGTNYVDLLARVARGNRIYLGEVEFSGAQRTRSSVLQRRVDLGVPGTPLDRIEAERGRHRLARLGIFRTVDLRYDIVDENTRNVIYTVQEGKRLNVSLLFGYGSYELLRGGIELEQHNVFGRAHHQRLRAIQSFRATNLDYDYTMPEFVGETVDLFINGSYLRREEISFTREEYGGGVGASTFFDNIESDFTARYSYQIVSTDEFISTEGPTNAVVGAIILDLRHDKRDSPLYPRIGYRVGSSLELASEFFGGEVNYARWESVSSFHQPLDEGRWLHFGASHGVIFTAGPSTEELPVNRRFFPGGESSVRGYQFGEAAPRNAAGDIVGAETYTLANIEFEQALTERWSLVAFVDAVGFARRLKNYPFDDYLLSVGGGIRWKTIIGPVRLEYGYNPVRRSEDPVGTLHFSLGFPF